MLRAGCVRDVGCGMWDVGCCSLLDCGAVGLWFGFVVWVCGLGFGLGGLVWGLGVWFGGLVWGLGVWNLGFSLELCYNYCRTTSLRAKQNPGFGPLLSFKIR